jgi:hypothetical protein
MNTFHFTFAGKYMASVFNTQRLVDIATRVLMANKEIQKTKNSVQRKRQS